MSVGNAPSQTPQPAPVHRRSSEFGNVVKVVVTLTVSTALIMWMMTRVDIHQVFHILRHGVRYEFIFAMMLTTMLSHMIRGIRWGIQLRAAGVPRMSVTAESVSIFGAYALNLLFPFLGEAWRCVYVAKRERVPMDTVVGTDIGDRASDGGVIAILIVLCVFVARPAMEKFLQHYAIGADIDRMLAHGALWITVLSVLAVLILLDVIFRKTKAVRKINGSLLRTWRGFAVLFHMKGIGAYLWLTLGIWTCYFLNTYLCFFAFDFTRALITAPGSYWGLVPGLVVFVFGSCSMIVPSNGGLGPWNIAVMFALSLYGVSDTDGGAFALICWTFQTFMQIALGIFSAFYILNYRHHHRTRPTTPTAS